MVIKREYSLPEGEPVALPSPHKCVTEVKELSHSPPCSSPPVEKKKLKRWSPLGWMRSVDEAHMRKQSQDGGELSPKSILRARNKRTLSDGAAPKHVGFAGEIKVIQLDEEGQHVCTCKDKLTVEPKNREAFLHRNMMRMMARDNVENGNLTLLQVTPDAAASQANVTLTFIPDKGQGVSMKMVVSVGCKFKPEDLCVKANMSGNRLRIMANTESLELSGRTDRFNERFSLPVTVDPYAVQARLDLKGNLTIEAPVVSQPGSKSTGSLTLNNNVPY